LLKISSAQTKKSYLLCIEALLVAIIKKGGGVMSLQNNNNNDKNNDKNKKEKKSLYQVMDKQGFYIILILCVAIVTATALWVDNQKEEQFIGEGPTNPFGEEVQPEVTLVEENQAIEDIDEAQETGKIGVGKPEEEVKQEVKKDIEEEVKEEVKKPNAPQSKDTQEEVENTQETAASVEESTETSSTTNMMVPVLGQLGLPFADDHLVYHKTLDQWSTHKGIDIKANEGTPVKAALDGEVVEVITDTIQGIVITLQHENDIYTRYSNLSTDAMVKVGDKVTKGQTISGVGKTAANKSLEGPLLHFQVLNDDNFVDPQIYLGKINK